MTKFLHRRALAFKYAFEGCWFVLRTQRNTWIHAMASFLVVLLAIALQLSRIEWAILLIVIAIVWITEFINTALESIIDLASPTIHPLAKVGKDIGAAAVLIAALLAVLVGLLILGPPLWQLLFS